MSSTPENQQRQRDVSNAIAVLTDQMEYDREYQRSNICVHHIEPLKSIVAHFTHVRLTEIWQIRQGQSNSALKKQLQEKHAQLLAEVMQNRDEYADLQGEDFE